MRKKGWELFCVTTGLFLLFFLLPVEVEAQTTRVRLQTGLEAVESRDEMGSPFLYSGQGAPLSLGLSHQRRRIYLDLRAQFLRAPLQAERATEDSHRADAILVDLEIFLGRRLLSFGGHDLRIGPEIQTSTFYRDYTYDSFQIGTVEIWDSPLTLNVRAELLRRLGPLELGAAMSLPLFGWVMRPDYAIRGDERITMMERRYRVLEFGEFATWPDLQALRARLTGEFFFGRYWGAHLMVSTSFFRFQRDLETGALRRTVLLGLSLRI